MGLVVEVDISAGSGSGTFGQEPQGEGGDILLFFTRGFDPIGDIEAERLGWIEDVNHAPEAIAAMPSHERNDLGGGIETDDGARPGEGGWDHRGGGLEPA